ncbi:hypothetical protein [Endozoicomonas sp. SESOKO1]|uniref:hypothetical protein n=1 Tax=Endozoicomonas sp. SESOKO1 TaxID=2828742 RepID=UPI00214753F2|nr:hypothetical protein [Endozoicomonas sp. SESOKO1]
MKKKNDQDNSRKESIQVVVKEHTNIIDAMKSIQASGLMPTRKKRIYTKEEKEQWMRECLRRNGIEE